MRKCSVLIVEDDEGIQELLRAVLRNHASQIDAVADGQTAIESLNRRDYDLVMLDIMLPRANGFAVADAIRALPAPPKLIVMSAIARYCTDRFPENTVVVQKPFDTAIIEAEVLRLNRTLKPDATVTAAAC